MDLVVKACKRVTRYSQVAILLGVLSGLTLVFWNDVTQEAFYSHQTYISLVFLPLAGHFSFQPGRCSAHRHCGVRCTEPWLLCASL